MDYPNILNAVNALNALSAPATDPGLSAENYRVFEDLQRRGVRLKDIVERAESPTDPAVFGAMEQAVASDPDVASAKTAMESARDAALTRLLMSDRPYSDAYRAYRDAVTKAYVRPKALNDPSV